MPGKLLTQRNWFMFTMLHSVWTTDWNSWENFLLPRE